MLGSSGAHVVERKFFDQMPTEQEVREIAALLPGGVRDIVSTRGRRYKELGLAEQELTDEQLISLLAVEPWLWRRPVVVKGKSATVGFNQEALEELLR